MYRCRGCAELQMYRCTEQSAEQKKKLLKRLKAGPVRQVPANRPLELQWAKKLQAGLVFKTPRNYKIKNKTDSYIPSDCFCTAIQ